MCDAFRLTVIGKPQPAGSKQSFVPLNRNTRQPFRRPGGGVVVATVDSNPKSKEWKQHVAFEARRAFTGEPWTGPLQAHFVFTRARPKNHFGSGRNAAVLKPGASEWCSTRPDVLKLSRAIEDSLIGVVYADDSQICVETIEKRYGPVDRVDITVKKLGECD